MQATRPGRTVRRAIRVYSPGRVAAKTDEVCTEEPLEIRLTCQAGGQRVRQTVAVTMRTPGNDFELVAGYLYSEGVLRDPHDLETMEYCTGDEEEQQYNIINVVLRDGVTPDLSGLDRRSFMSSSCGVCGKASIDSLQSVCTKVPPSDFTVAPETVISLPKALAESQLIFNRTGGLHAVALFQIDGTLVVLREDVGRHNAMDKAVGHLFLNHKLPAGRMIALVSGRASFEVVQKAIVAGVPLLAAVGAPSSLAIALSEQYGLTLAGFLRDERFNVYCAAERIGRWQPVEAAGGS